MAKIVLDEVAAGYDLSKINDNFNKIEQEFQDKVFYRNNPDGEPNTFEKDIDVNSKRLYNLAAPVSANDAARLTDVQAAIAGLPTASTVPFTPAGDIAATTVQGAIQELDTEKAPLASPALTGNPTAPTPAVGDNDTSIATTAFVRAEFGNGFAGGGFGFKNKIINGNFLIWQRGTSQTTPGIVSDDRWDNVQIGSAKTASRQTFALGQTDVPGSPIYFARTVVSSVAGSGNVIMKRQKIEGVARSSGTTFTLSFYAKADAARNIAVDFEQFFGTGGSPSTSVTGIGARKFALTTAWQRFTMTVTMPSIAGKTLGTAGNDWFAPAFWFDAGSSFNARTDSLGQQSGTFDLALIQLEEGAVATPFEDRPLGVELALCQRYYEKSFNYGVAPIQNVGSTDGALAGPGSSASSYMLGQVQYTVTKRTTATITTYNPTAAGSEWRDGANTINSTPAVFSSGTRGFGVSGNSSSPMSTLTIWYIHWTADAEL